MIDIRIQGWVLWILVGTYFFVMIPKAILAADDMWDLWHCAHVEGQADGH
jgi:hypothetical protein